MRPEILFPLFAPVTTLRGVGARVAPLLQRVAGPRVRDLLFVSPQSVIRRYDAKASHAVEGLIQTFTITVESHRPPARANLPWKIRTFDDTGFITLVFFKAHGPHLERAHPIGSARVVSGKVEQDPYGTVWQIVHPDYLLPVARGSEIPTVEPVYAATSGLPSRALRRLMLEALARAPNLAEWQDPSWLARQKWPSWRDALEALHHPSDDSAVSPGAPHRRRLAFDELLAHQLALSQRKRDRRHQPAPMIGASQRADRARSALPFRLTGAQIRTLGEIRGDLASGLRMTRLIQGDVGAGKTVVAMLAMIDVAASGRQSVLMAPTEILARQHFETLAGPLAAQGFEAVLLTGRYKGDARAAKLGMIAHGQAAVIVGTHALFQGDVNYAELGLTVIDEQHRFGVAERSRLQAKGGAAHLLAMSATPIPRTLELTAFGDLDVSKLDEKPPGRAPIATRAAPLPRLGEVISRLKAAVVAGAQVFWICPLVVESELTDLAAAEARYANLKRLFGHKVGLIHGRLPPAKKDAVMADFAEGRLAVLVATTAVEVGVDVPAATIMVVEQAERFGLAQLHQLRGRVGRGKAGSSCVLLYDPQISELAARRLDILRRTDDGFAIAEMDLELRGGGDPLGLKQSGFPLYRLADPVAHRDLIAAAADDARLIMARDPDLLSPRGAAVRVLQELFDWRGDAAISEVG
ncbi:MAG: ATP-dependent DNA helicase RecG [Pseudomonadota bacterium]|nr:ATP-dependent DNA helicase RecG [Pseudomonadota bacterium]